MGPLTKTKLNNIAFWLFMISVAFTALGPIIHYTFGSAALLLVLVCAFDKNSHYLQSVFSKDSKLIIALFLAFSLWSIFPNYVNVKNFYTWGKGASIVLEAAIFMMLGAYLFNSEDRRGKFAFVFIVFNALFAMYILIHNFYPLLSINGALDNINVMGVYALLIIPVFCGYSLWKIKNALLRYFLPVIGMLVLICSFSAGAWAAGVVVAIVGVLFAVKSKRITVKFTLCSLLSLAICLFALNVYSNNFFYDRFMIEINQITDVRDVKHFTTHRADIWCVTYYMIKKHPIIGQGMATFYENYSKVYSDLNLRDLLNVNPEIIADDPHNMYLLSAYSAGIPAMTLLVIFLLLMLARTFKLAVLELRRDGIPWGLISLLMLIGQIVQGLSGDIFDARRDIGVIFWAVMGLSLALPYDNGKTNSDRSYEKDAM